MAQNRNIAYARPQGGSSPIVQGVLDGLASTARAILSVTNSAVVEYPIQAVSGLLRVASVAQGVFIKLGSGVSKTTTKGTAVFTITDAIVAGVHAQSVITSDGTAPADGSEIVIGDITYTARTSLTTDPATVPYEVLIGASAAAFLDNLKSAISGTAGEGSTYSTGTEAHPDVVAHTNTDTTQLIVARLPGVAYNDNATTTDDDHLSWEDTTLGGGTGSSVAGVDGETVTIGNETYTFVTALSETAGATAVPNQVLFGAASANALDNLKLAIDKGATEGTNYSTGTVAHPYVTATTNTDTAQTVEARQAGSGYDDLALSDTVENGSWSDTTLGDNVLDFDVYIPTGGTQDIAIPEGTSGISLIGDGGTATVVITEY